MSGWYPLQGGHGLLVQRDRVRGPARLLVGEGEVVPRLQGAGWSGLHAIAFDLPGLGLADRPREFDYSWTTQCVQRTRQSSQIFKFFALSAIKICAFCHQDEYLADRGWLPRGD